MIALDSSFLIAFKVANDPHHERATALMNQIVASERYGRPFVSDYIFDETVTGIFIRSKNLRLAVEYGSELLGSLDLLEIYEENFRTAWKLFSEQKNRRLSFTDCTTIAVMRAHDARRIATFDGDFEDVEGISAIG